MTEKICPFCQPLPEYAHLDIARFPLWRVALHNNQYFPGRCLVILNRHAENAFLEATEEEHREARVIMFALWLATQKLFGATLPNFANLENEIRHAHWYLVPRYENPVVINGETFKDELWGKNYAAYRRDFIIKPETEKLIISQLKEELKL